MINILKNDDQLLLEYTPDGNSDPRWVDHKLQREGSVTLRRTFTFRPHGLVKKNDSDDFSEDVRTFVLGVTDGDFYRIDKEILGLNNDLLLSRGMVISDKAFVAYRDISIFRRIDDLVDDSIVIGGDTANSIPIDGFDELLRNFPSSTELTYYARARITRTLKDYLNTKSDAQLKLDNYLNNKKTIRPNSRIEFIRDYEPKKFEYVRDEILAMLSEADAKPDAYKEKDWQRQIVQFLLLIFPKYVAVLENVHIKDFYSNPGKTTDRYIDLLLVDANGTVDVIEVKRPWPHQLLSRKPGSRGNYTPNGELSEAVMQVEKYLFHLSKWGQPGEHAIQEKHKSELPPGFELRITNPKAMVILGRNKDFAGNQKFDFEIIKRKYANIIDIMTYDDLLRRLDNIISMIGKNYSKLGAVPKDRADLHANNVE